MQIAVVLRLLHVKKGTVRFPDGKPRTSYEVSFVVVLFLSRDVSLK
jgi:hypothetical protein